MQIIWMCMIEEEDSRIIRELEVEAFTDPGRVWTKLNEYSKEKASQTFLEFVDKPDDPVDFLDPTVYAWTWHVHLLQEDVRIHVLRMPLIEGEESVADQS